MSTFKRAEEIAWEMSAVVFARMPGVVTKVGGPTWHEHSNTYVIHFARHRGAGRDYWAAHVPEEWIQRPDWKQIWLTMLLERDTPPEWVLTYVENNMEALLHDG